MTGVGEPGLEAEPYTPMALPLCWEVGLKRGEGRGAWWRELEFLMLFDEFLMSKDEVEIGLDDPPKDLENS